MSCYAVSDLHGYLNLYKQIKAFLKPDDIVFCLGDCGDRGPQPWETIKAVASDSQFVYMRGNHEDLLAYAMMEYLEDYETLWKECEYISPLVDCLNNGGLCTLADWQRDGMDKSWINFLRTLPTQYTYTNQSGITVVLSHAGYTPGNEDKLSTYDLLWDRNHFIDDWPENHDNEMVVFGHTPCGLINPKWKPNEKALWLHGHKIAIDMGTPVTKAALLLDLDTFDEHLFVEEEDNKDY